MVTLQCQQHQFDNITAIIFDKDGTLADSEQFLRELGQKRARLLDAKIPGVGEPLLMAFGIEQASLNPVGLMAVGSRYENEIAAAAYVAETGRGWLDSCAIAQAAFSEADEHFTANAETSPLFTGCLETLQTLAEAGLKLAILSADTQAGVENFMARHELSPYIQVAKGVSAEGLQKPNPQLFLDTCEALGVKPNQALMVGDAPGDIEMAKNAGASGAIGICWRDPKSSHLEDADCFIQQLNDLKIS
ncbi:HAD-superfamily hydrolase, subfamily IA, variant 1 [Halothece sp. PCC 7418]|uniref:HAD family hydrolase n=1 Tax=Halothece sp. (strain PCC 7418) TaxID=65093 RepID=UPI0002A0627F|nr:HAD family hydrolase [Halothece sp. PCC 7418]AFZ44224.1 HAD-superfamily hydrolase, subfamily IA, variant 1 [Halothece sp. PCC 7418]